MDEDDEHEQDSWNMQKLSQLFQVIKHTMLYGEMLAEFEPSIEHSLNIIHGITDTLRLYKEMFDELKRQQQQLPITMLLT